MGLFSVSRASASLLEMLELHFQLADPAQSLTNGGSARSSVSYANTDLRFILDESDAFMKTDLTQLLNTPNRKKELDAYLVDGANLSQLLNYHYLNNASQLSSEKNRLESCQTQLSSANANYKTALQNHQEALYNSAISQAKQARVCIGEATVGVSSLQTLNVKIANYRTAIDKRTKYLVANRYKIIENYEFLDRAKLSELQSITAALESTKK